jgi:hypothetical protein
MADFANAQSVLSSALGVIGFLARREPASTASADRVRFRSAIEQFIGQRRRADEIIRAMRRISFDPAIRARPDERDRVEYRIEVMSSAMRTTERTYSEFLEAAMLRDLAN